MKWDNKSVLIAEDEETNYLLLAEYLEPTGINIRRAQNGLEVLDILNTYTPDIVLLDIKMPFMNGYDVIRVIRKSKKHLPVIAQTAYVMRGDMEKILDAGCNEYLSKPINEMELLRILEKYLNK
jgi:CheY-like chemotaxis protein